MKKQEKSGMKVGGKRKSGQIAVPENFVPRARHMSRLSKAYISRGTPSHGGNHAMFVLTMNRRRGRGSGTRHHSILLGIIPILPVQGVNAAGTDSLASEHSHSLQDHGPPLEIDLHPF